MKCPRCRVENEPGYRFCGNCGSASDGHELGATGRLLQEASTSREALNTATSPHVFSAPVARTDSAPDDAVRQPEQSRVASVGRALFTAIGTAILSCVALVLLLVSVFSATSGASGSDDTGGVTMLLVGFSCATAAAIWFGVRAGRGWGAVAFVMVGVVIPLYIYRQRRGMMSPRTGQPLRQFPALVVNAGMFTCALLLIAGSVALSDPGSAPAEAVGTPALTDLADNLVLSATATVTPLAMATVSTSEQDGPSVTASEPGSLAHGSPPTATPHRTQPPTLARAERTHEHTAVSTDESATTTGGKAAKTEAPSGDSRDGPVGTSYDAITTVLASTLPGGTSRYDSLAVAVALTSCGAVSMIRPISGGTDVSDWADSFSAKWSSDRRRSGWLVTFTYRVTPNTCFSAPVGVQQATWFHDPRTGDVVADNRSAELFEGFD
jgi:hypothetical protein